MPYEIRFREERTAKETYNSIKYSLDHDSDLALCIQYDNSQSLIVPNCQLVGMLERKINELPMPSIRKKFHVYEIK